jgi:hypothetical protein
MALADLPVKPEIVGHSLERIGIVAHEKLGAHGCGNRRQLSLERIGFALAQAFHEAQPSADAIPDAYRFLLGTAWTQEKPTCTNHRMVTGSLVR